MLVNSPELPTELEHNGLVFLRPNWPVPPNVKAFMTTRIGGLSVAPYAGLNLSANTGDVPETVAANLVLLNAHLPAPALWLKQTHSTTVLSAQLIASSPELLEADASYTMASNQVCAVMTADCLPVLLCTKDGLAVAAAHTGWRGLCAGIIEKTLAALLAEHGKAQVSDVLVWFGAAIGEDAFEVGQDVMNAFVKHNGAALSAFTALSEPESPESGKYLANIYQLAEQRLLSVGVSREQIYGGSHCTVIEKSLFYSHRRDNQTGRMASLIWLT
ncbi:MAG: peptidoglycan editing factor PgeF [Neisseriaceae bacterium]|nr:peptidoglycan editing factor PgeF [Neisseriaceae bacterium]